MGFRRNVKRWGVCLSCGERQMFDRREIDTRRGARCGRCGGRLDPSPPQKAQSAAVAAKMAEVTAKRQADDAVPQ